MNRTEIKHWKAQTADLPTWRDGLNGSDRSYLIVAVPQESTDGYKAVVFGRYNAGGKGKLKFYPTPEAMGIDRRSLYAMGITGELDRSNGGNDSGYVRYMASLEQVQQLLTGLEPTAWAICPLDKIQGALTDKLGRESSRVRAPLDNQHVLIDLKDEGGLKPLVVKKDGLTKPNGAKEVLTDGGEIDKAAVEQPSAEDIQKFRKFVRDAVDTVSGTIIPDDPQDDTTIGTMALDDVNLTEICMYIEDWQLEHRDDQQKIEQVPNNLLASAKTFGDIVGKLREHPGLFDQVIAKAQVAT